MKIIVIDDDPTGSQAVYGCPLLLKWDEKTLLKGLAYPSPLLFILANTRSMEEDSVKKTINEISYSIRKAIQKQNLLLEEIFFVSRGDSTLRGHGFLEPKLINERLGPFDATFHIPAFLEGCRTTVNGIHLLNGIPVHMTPFAKDSLFGYSTSKLDVWLQEKSKGKINSKDVLRLDVNLLNSANESNFGRKKLSDWLLKLTGNQPVVVDVDKQQHIQRLGIAFRGLIGKKRFLFRSAASLIAGLADLSQNPLTPFSLSQLRLKDRMGIPKPGLVLVGSHVKLADDQLTNLLQEKSCIGIEISVEKIAEIGNDFSRKNLLLEFEERLLKKINHILMLGKTPVLYTSRTQLEFESPIDRVDFGNQLAEILATTVAKLSTKLGYIISKGGITTNTLLAVGLDLDLVHLKGQLLPGLSVVLPVGSLNKLPIITFPGNLGDAQTLLKSWKLMENLN